MCGQNKNLGPFRSICEFLTAIHIYADEAREGKTRYVPAFHYCAHVRHDLRQCLIYDSHEKGARLIGVEHMVPKFVYDAFPDEEKKLWHSHEYEVKSGMLILPKPDGVDEEEWEKKELEAMKEVDAGDEFPLGAPRLMGSATQAGQVNLDEALAERNRTFGVDHARKAEARKHIPQPSLSPEADSWWKGKV